MPHLGYIPENTASILQLIFDEISPSKCKIDSYNQFVTSGLPRIYHNLFPHITNGKNRWLVIEFIDLSIHKPVHTESDGTVRIITPQECRLRGLTYEASIWLHLRVSIYELADEKVESNAAGLERLKAVGKFMRSYEKSICPHCIPVMIGSVLDHQADPATFQHARQTCPYDEGGNFIINGTEHNMSYGERLRYNIPIFTKAAQLTYKYEVELRSEHEGKFRASSTIAGRLATTPKSRKLEAKVQFNPSQKTKRANRMDSISLPLLLRALGIVSRRDIIRMFHNAAGKCFTPLHREVLMNSLQLSEEKDQEEAIKDLGNLLSNGKAMRAMDKGLRYLRKELFPHIGITDDSFYNKAFLLCNIFCQLCERAFVDQMQDSRDPEKEIRPSPWSNRDDMTNKAWDLPGSLLGSLIRQILILAHRNLSLQVRPPLRSEGVYRKPPDLNVAYRNTKINPGVRDRLATGIWHAKKSVTNKRTGQTQTQTRCNTLDSIAQNRRTLAHVSNESRQSQPRLIWQQWGILDFAATPDGINCGVVKERTPVERSSMGTKPHTLYLLLSKFGVVPLESVGHIEDLANWGVPIFVNGNPWGFYRGDPNDVVTYFLRCRRRFLIDPDTSWSFQRLHPMICPEKGMRDPSTISAVNFFTDEGRMLRPLFVTENMYKLRWLKGKRYTWSTLLELNIVEYIDKVEEMYCLVALRPEDVTPEHHYCEIHPASILGFTTSVIPFANYVYGTRITHSCMMMRSAFGYHSQDVDKRMDTSANVSLYPERPLSNSLWHSVLRSFQLPVSSNVSVLMHNFRGLGPEDQAVNNEDTAMRGWGNGRETRTNIIKQRRVDTRMNVDYNPALDPLLTHSKITGSIERNSNGEEIGLFSASECQGRKRADYSQIQSDGVIRVGARAFPNSVIVQKTQPLPPKATYAYDEITGNGQSKTTTISYRDVSVMLKPTEKGIVTYVLITTDKDGQPVVKVKIRNSIRFETGDKLTSLMGQKGVGYCQRECDFPYTNDRYARRPTHIVDAVCFYPRMTCGQDYEGFLNQIILALAQYEDAVTWNEHQLRCLQEMCKAKVNSPDFDLGECLGDVLFQLGYSRDCSASFIDGRTGARIKNTLFFVTNEILQLKHRSEKKLRARNFGRRDALTQLPVPKRVKGGGLKVGEQERATFTSNGAAENIRERLFFSADADFAYICRNCHTISFAPNTKTAKTLCLGCSTWNCTDVVELPHVTKLLEGYLRSMCLVTKFFTQRVEKNKILTSWAKQREKAI